MPKPIDQTVPDHHQIGSSPAVKENRCSPLGIVKDFTHSARAKATEVMRDVALSIARKIDGIWDRISPRHKGSALMGVNSIFKDPTISILQLNERMAPPVPTHKEVKALFDLRSEILQLGRNPNRKAEMESKIKEYDVLLESMGGREGDFYKRVDALGYSVMQKVEEQQRQQQENPLVAFDGGAFIAQKYSNDFEMEGLKAMLEGPYANVSGAHAESDKPYIDDHFEIELDPWNWQVPNTPGRSVCAAMDELFKRTKTNAEGGKGLVPNFRIAVANEAEVKRWMDVCPTNFSSAPDEDLVNYIKRRLGADGVFASNMSREVIQHFNERAANLSPEDKTQLIHDIRESLLKDRTGKISKQVSEFIKLIGPLYKKTDDDQRSSNNTRSFLVALAGPFTAKVQEIEKLEGKSSMLPIETGDLISFICENYEQILIED